MIVLDILIKGRRPGSFAMYIEPWHADIFQFLDAKKNHGNEEERARDSFTHYGFQIYSRNMLKTIKNGI